MRHGQPSAAAFALDGVEVLSILKEGTKEKRNYAGFEAMDSSHPKET